MNRFENLGLAVQRDLDVVRYSRRKDISMPKFHYEKKNFNIVRCNTDLTDNELEIVVVRGINYNVSNPKDVDTYVKVEFPLLNVSKCYDSNNNNSQLTRTNRRNSIPFIGKLFQGENKFD